MTESPWFNGNYVIRDLIMMQRLGTLYLGVQRLYNDAETGYSVST